MIKNNLKMFELNKELKKADGIIFSPSENLEIEPSVVILVFKSKEKSDKIRDALNVKNSEYNLVIIKENDNINISIIAKHINEVFNIDKLPYKQLSRGYLLQCGMQDGKITSNLCDDAALVDIINRYTIIRMARNSSNHARHEKGDSPREIEEKILSGICELREQAAYLKSKQEVKS